MTQIIFILYSVLEPKKKSMKTLTLTPVTSSLKTQNFDGDEIDLLSGIYVDFGEVDSDDVNALDLRQKSVVAAVRDLYKDESKVKPMMVFDIAPMENLELLGPDGKKLENKNENKKKKGYAKILVPCSQIVDITNLKPKAGESVVRCNPAFPHYRWFQAINAILSFENKTEGRVIPFPLQVEHDGQEETIYHVMRVNKAEYEAYQRLLIHAVQSDGTEMGFYHAAKFSYEILSKRGCKEITKKEVGEAVTKITMFGKPVMKGVVINNASTEEDLKGELKTSHYIYAT